MKRNLNVEIIIKDTDSSTVIIIDNESGDMVSFLVPNDMNEDAENEAARSIGNEILSWIEMMQENFEK